jgi:hypothetical protein
MNCLKQKCRSEAKQFELCVYLGFLSDVISQKAGGKLKIQLNNDVITKQFFLRVIHRIYSSGQGFCYIRNFKYTHYLIQNKTRGRTAEIEIV